MTPTEKPIPSACGTGRSPARNANPTPTTVETTDNDANARTAIHVPSAIAAIITHHSDDHRSRRTKPPSMVADPGMRETVA
ncbi:MAG: hypothetical protein AB7Q42_03090 [Acidimicrobiia bacterium]